MARPRAPVSYGIDLVVTDPAAAAATPRQAAVANAASLAQVPAPEETSRLANRSRRPLEEKADASVLYLHPSGKKTLRLYAVERGVKVHDLILEALEEWAERHGLSGPWRVPSAGPPRRQRD